MNLQSPKKLSKSDLMMISDIRDIKVKIKTSKKINYYEIKEKR